MSKKLVTVRYPESGKAQIELNCESLLSEIRKDLLDIIIFPFVFADDSEIEIPKEKETQLKLKDILDGKNLYVQKGKNQSAMLGRKVNSKKWLNFYVYPQRKLTNEEKNSSSNIMVIGVTGVG